MRGVVRFLWLVLFSGSASPSFAADPITINVPAEHRYVTVVVDDAKGVRVRNLVSMGAVTNGTLKVAWDGKDEDGRAVPPGQYRVRGLSLPGLRAHFAYAWYNPGNPPWPGYPGSGWAGDHSQPSGIAASSNGWRVVITSPSAEGGDPILALNDDLQKVFAYKIGWAGSPCIAVADGAAWLAIGGTKLTRLELGTGHVRPWPTPDDDVPEIILPAPAHRLAVGPEHVAICTETAQLVLLDKLTGHVVREEPLPAKCAVAYDAAGRLFVAARESLPSVAKLGAVTFDAQGRLFVMDDGPDQQIKVFDKGQLVRAVGARGGQKGLAYNRLAVRAVDALAVDAQGWLWVVENTHPCRLSVWDETGALVREFIGNAHYGANNMALHEQDPTVGVAYNVLFQIDPAQPQTYRPTGWLNAGRKPGSPFFLWGEAPSMPNWFTRGSLFRRGQHEYYLEPYQGHTVLYRRRNGEYRPVMALVTNFPGRPPVLDRPHDPPGTFYVWSDLNEDELVQDAEVQTFPPEGGYHPVTGWVSHLSSDFTLYTKTSALTPSRFTTSGVPVYDMQRVQRLTADCPNGQGPHTRVGKHLVRTDDGVELFSGWRVFTDLAGRVVAKYKTQGLGVQGSHLHGVLPPGQPLGELFISGIADYGAPLGTVFATHGNRGQAFFWTEDGLFISSLFKDHRDHPKPYGDRLVPGADWTDATMGVEVFGGWFGRQSDGKTRYLFGHTVALVVEVTGLEDVRRFETGRILIP